MENMTFVGHNKDKRRRGIQRVIYLSNLFKLLAEKASLVTRKVDEDLMATDVISCYYTKETNGPYKSFSSAEETSLKNVYNMR